MHSDNLFMEEDTATVVAETDMSAPWNILIVDDDHGVHDTTRFVLTKATHHGRKLSIESAFSGLEAIHLILNTKDRLPDLVLMDVVMTTPTDGIDTTHRIRKVLDQRIIPYVIVRTGQGGTMQDDRALAHDPDIDEVVRKQEMTAEKLKVVVFNGLDKVSQRLKSAE